MYDAVQMELPKHPHQSYAYGPRPVIVTHPVEEMFFNNNFRKCIQDCLMYNVVKSTFYIKKLRSCDTPMASFAVRTSYTMDYVVHCTPTMTETTDGIPIDLILFQVLLQPCESRAFHCLPIQVGRAIGR